MNIIIITQNEPFFIAKHLDYFFKKAPSWVNISGTVLLEASPFGKAGSFFERVKRTYNVFGLEFFSRYSIRYIVAKTIERDQLLRNTLHRNEIDEIKLPKKDINAEQCLEVFAYFKPDLIISISANQLFKKDLISLPTHGCLNLHTARLPEYKGLMPSFWALKNNEKEIGVSVFFMDEGIDTGEIIVQKVIPIIKDSDTLESLIDKSKQVGMDAIIEALELLKSGQYKTLKFSSGEGSYYSFPTRNDAEEFRRAGKKFW